MSDISKRKNNHVDVCMHEDVSYRKSNGLERYEFIHNALPELDFEKISTDTRLFDKLMVQPLIISGMTGGPDLSKKINTTLAKAAEVAGVGMGVGSQRILLEKPDMLGSFDVRTHFAGPLLANIGAVQLNYGLSEDDCKKIVSMIKADALVLHLNAMQEVIQGGDTDFFGLLKKIKKLCHHLKVPVIVKEVGFGISAQAGQKLAKCGVFGIDISGTGGTSWSAVESYLAKPPMDRVGKTFWDWGIPTARAIEMNKDLHCKIIAGGGIRSGLDTAKALALGADFVSVAGPLLKAAMQGVEETVQILDAFRIELKTAMFGIGAKDIEDLKNTQTLQEQG